MIAALDESIDKYVEVYIGKYGRPKMSSRTNTVQVKNLTEKNAVQFIKVCIGVLTDVLPKNLKKTDTDLLNIRDEMLGELNQLLYLFTLQ